MEIVYRRPAAADNLPVSSSGPPQVRRMILPQYPHYMLHRCSTDRILFPTVKLAVDYLTRLRETAKDHGVTIHTYTLLQQQVHLLVTPSSPAALSLTFKRLNGSFAHRTLRAQGYSRRRLFVKALAMPVHPDHALRAIRWIERLYLKAGEYYAGDSVVSSYSSRADGVHDMFLTSPWVGAEPLGGAGWRTFVAGFPKEDEQAILTRLGSGYPWGPSEWVAELEAKYGKRLQPKRSRGLSLGESASSVLIPSSGSPPGA